MKTIVSIIKSDYIDASPLSSIQVNQYSDSDILYYNNVYDKVSLDILRVA